MGSLALRTRSRGPLCMESGPPPGDTGRSMSQENVEMIRRAFEAYERGDLDRAVADMAPDCEYIAVGTVPGHAGTYRGLRDTRNLWRGWLRSSAMPTRMSTP